MITYLAILKQHEIMAFLEPYLISYLPIYLPSYHFTKIYKNI